MISAEMQNPFLLFGLLNWIILFHDFTKKKCLTRFCINTTQLPVETAVATYHQFVRRNMKL
jgi:hypothetical protein